MSKRTRICLITILTILFLLVATLSVFYSLGWRIDWKNRKIIQVGFLYCKVWPKNAEVYINGKLEKKTDFFFGSALIEELLPGSYTVEVKKEGFHDWKKILLVQKRQVCEVKNIFLVPENPKFTIISTKIEEFFLSPNGKKIVLKEEVIDQKTKEKTWDLKLFEAENNVKSHLISEKDFKIKDNIAEQKQGGAELIDLKFSPDSKQVLLSIGRGEKINNYLLLVDNAPPLLTAIDFLDLDGGSLYFNPQNKQALFLLKDGKLSEIDIEKKEIFMPLLAQDLITLSVFQDSVYYLDNQGFVFRTDFGFSDKEKINILSLPIKEEAEYKIDKIDTFLFLKEDNSLYEFDATEKIFTKIYALVENFISCQDSKKIAYFNDYEIWILFLNKIYEQPYREKGEKIFLVQSPEKIKEVFWWTNDYLIFNSDGKIKIVETDDRNKINIATLAEFPASAKIFWNQQDKKLYVLSKGDFFSSERLRP